MRFEVRFSNGYWKLFDTVEYESAELFYIKREADAACDRANGVRR